MTDTTLKDTLPSLPILNVEEIVKKEIPQREGWLPRDKRKTILLLSDDLRMPSGVGVMSREIVMGTCHRINWIQLGAAINHPEVGKGVDVSESLSNELGVKDPYLRIFPYNGYGDAGILRFLIKTEKPDAIMHFTDPRFWGWLYQMEHEIRKTMPILYYHVWDDVPYPKYNENFYRSCDAIYGISKQTHNLVKQVWKKDPPKKWQLKYIPHGVDHNIWKVLTDEKDVSDVKAMRQKLFGDSWEDVKFVVLYNNRNIRRKVPGDVILGFQEFLKKIPAEERDSCRLLFHTAPVDDNGTDLPAVLRDVAPEIKAAFSTDRIPPQEMVKLYNNVDVVINMASNEGFGIGTLEAMMTERMIIANVTGGLQDQMGFVDEEGNYLDADIHYCEEWGTNADGKYREHGEWVVPLFPNNRSLIGSPPTPYIFDDRCDYRDAGDAIYEIYQLSPEERARRGKLGREWAISDNAKMTSEAMCNTFLDAFGDVFENWTPRDRFNIFMSE